MSYIYALKHPENGEIRYVGKTDRTLEMRKSEHQYNAKRLKTYVYCWVRSLSRFPVMEVLEECEPGQASDREKFWIEKLKNEGVRLTNLTDGGEGQSGLIHSLETRQRMSQKNKGRAQPWCKENIKAAHAAIRGQKLTGEHRSKVLAGLSKAIVAARSPESKVARSRSRGCLPIRCLENGQLYQTAAEAAKCLNLDASSVAKACKGIRLKSTGGFHFQYVLNPNL